MSDSRGVEAGVIALFPRKTAIPASRWGNRGQKLPTSEHTMKIMVVAGARPNFMKVAPLIEALRAVQARCPALEYTLVHMARHYDVQMSQPFFEDLGLPRPDVDLGCGVRQSCGANRQDHDSF